MWSLLLTQKRHNCKSWKRLNAFVLGRPKSVVVCVQLTHSWWGITIANDEFECELTILSMRIGAVKDWVQPGESLVFGEIKLKPMQMAILKCNRKNDVLVNLPTGFGKSLLFQYPASQLRDKCIVVFVPLKALLWDCLKEAELHNLTAVQCDTNFVKKYEKHGFLPQLLFLTPERLFMNHNVMGILECLHLEEKIELFVIDEAHCISEWGSDFRPDYARLGEIRTLFPGVRMLGMSATIPPQALKDLTARLQITGCHYFQSSSNRPNLIYEVMSTEKSKLAGSIVDYIKMKQLKDQSGIIYCQTIKNAEEVFKEISKFEVSCCLFHSKLPERKRQENFDGFMNGGIKCIVATICFGMGVNKKNIRYVINAGVSLSAQNYYQQSGRAGRDGQISFCLLLTYGPDDIPLKWLINNSTKKKVLVKRKLYKLQQLKVYAKVKECRKRNLFKLLGEDFSVQQCRKTCDFCMNDMGRNIEYETLDYSQKGFWIIEEMQKFKELITKKQLVNFLKGKDIITNKITKQKYMNLYQCLKSEKLENIELLVELMVEKGLLVEVSEVFKVRRIKRTIQYLKPCPKTISTKQKSQGLIVKTTKVKLQLKRPNKQAIPNPYVSDKFQKYVTKKAKSLDPLDFQVNFDKEQQSKKQKKLSQQDLDMKEIKMVTIGPDIQKFFDELFPENVHLSKSTGNDEEQGQYDGEEIMNIDNGETSFDELQDMPEAFEQLYIPNTQHKPQDFKEQQETPPAKTQSKQIKMKPSETNASFPNKNEEDSDDDSIFLMIKKKKQELRRKNEQLNKKEEVVVRRKLVTKNDFL